MSELIVLGLIPGTQIQITFLLWLIITGVVVIFGLMGLGHRARLFSTWVISISLFVATHRRLRA